MEALTILQAATAIVVIIGIVYIGQEKFFNKIYKKSRFKYYSLKASLLFIAVSVLLLLLYPANLAAIFLNSTISILSFLIHKWF